jgi:hypothetical protein
MATKCPIEFKHFSPFPLQEINPCELRLQNWKIDPKNSFGKTYFSRIEGKSNISMAIDGKDQKPGHIWEILGYYVGCSEFENSPWDPSVQITVTTVNSPDIPEITFTISKPSSAVFIPYIAKEQVPLDALSHDKIYFVPPNYVMPPQLFGHRICIYVQGKLIEGLLEKYTIVPHEAKRMYQLILGKERPPSTPFGPYKRNIVEQRGQLQQVQLQQVQLQQVQLQQVLPPTVLSPPQRVLIIPPPDLPPPVRVLLPPPGLPPPIRKIPPPGLQLPKERLILPQGVLPPPPPVPIKIPPFEALENIKSGNELVSSSYIKTLAAHVFRKNNIGPAEIANYLYNMTDLMLIETVIFMLQRTNAA